MRFRFYIKFHNPSTKHKNNNKEYFSISANEHNPPWKRTVNFTPTNIKWNIFSFLGQSQASRTICIRKARPKLNRYNKLNHNNIGPREKNHGQYLSCVYDVVIIQQTTTSFFNSIKQTWLFAGHYFSPVCLIWENG